MDNHELDDQISRLRESIPDDPSWTGLGLTRHDWHPVFDLCRQIQEAFKSGVRYPTRSDYDRAWSSFSELRSRAYATAKREREVLGYRSKDHLNSLLDRCRGITYSPVQDVLFFFDKTTADEVRAWQRVLAGVAQSFNELKPEMTGPHRKEMHECIQHIRDSHRLFWEHYNRAHAERRAQREKEFEERKAVRERKQKEWEARKAERERKQKEWEARKAERERKQKEWEARKAERERKQREFEARKAERERRQREWEARRAQQQRDWEARQREREQRRREWEDRKSSRGRGSSRGGRGGGGCYITTAVCRSRGLDDDCEPLRLLRVYRDNWLVNQPGGPELIERYYEVAPSLVEIVDAFADADKYYDGLWVEYLEPICGLIHDGAMEGALRQYEAMVAEVESILAPGFVGADRSTPRSPLAMRLRAGADTSLVSRSHSAATTSRRS